MRVLCPICVGIVAEGRVVPPTKWIHKECKKVNFRYAGRGIPGKTQGEAAPTMPEVQKQSTSTRMHGNTQR